MACNPSYSEGRGRRILKVAKTKLVGSIPSTERKRERRKRKRPKRDSQSILIQIRDRTQSTRSGYGRIHISLGLVVHSRDLGFSTEGFEQRSDMTLLPFGAVASPKVGIFF
jgi:hypothetical protein